MIVCPLCGSGISRIICDCRDIPPRINTLAGVIRRCTNCQFLYKEPIQQSLDALDEIYQYTVEETELMLRQAIDLHLEGLREDGVTIPEPASVVEYLEVPA